MDHNNKTLDWHPSVIAELDELESLLLVMLGCRISELPEKNRRSLTALEYRLVSAALDKAHGKTPA